MIPIFDMAEILDMQMPETPSAKRSVKLTSKNFMGHLKKAGHTREITLHDVIVQTAHIEGSISGRKTKKKLLISKEREVFYKINFTHKTFHDLVRIMCTPSAATRICALYENISTKPFRLNYVLEDLNGRFAAEIWRTGMSHDERFENFLEQICLEFKSLEDNGFERIYNLNGDNYSSALFSKWKELPSSENVWDLIANPIWQSVELYEPGSIEHPASLPCYKLLWGLRQYPQWQRAILTKMMSLNRILIEDVASLIHGYLFLTTLNQPMEELTSVSQHKRAGALLKEPQNKKARLS